MSDEDEDEKKKRGDYEVGYGKPPRHTQFQPGQSGKPSGRPKGAKGTKKNIRNMLNRATPVKIGDEVKHLSTFDLSMERLIEGVRKGDKTAIARVVALAREIDKDDDLKAAAAPQASAHVEPLTDEDHDIILEFLAAQKKLRDAF